jgi:hypothetical protein
VRVVVRVRHGFERHRSGVDERLHRLAAVVVERGEQRVLAGGQPQRGGDPPGRRAGRPTGRGSAARRRADRRGRRPASRGCRRSTARHPTCPWCRP